MTYSGAEGIHDCHPEPQTGVLESEAGMRAEEIYKYGSIPVPLRPPGGQQFQIWYSPRTDVGFPLPLIPMEW